MPSARADAELPNLQIVPTQSLLPHEKFDRQRSEPLVARLRAEGVLKNPPIVAPIQGEDLFVVLDGTNRAESLKAMACPHVVVQAVDYDDPRLILDTWFHVVSDMSCDDLLDAVQSLDGLHMKPARLRHARAELAHRQAAAYMLVPRAPAQRKGVRGRLARHGRASVYLLQAEGDMYGQTAALARLVEVYELRGRIHRVNSDQLESLLSLYENVAALVVFPQYTPSEIMELARRGAYLPPGITRHVIPGRVLRLNFPLSVLADDRPLDEKNAWLQEWLRAKLANKEIRFYQESTYLFDE